MTFVGREEIPFRGLHLVHLDALTHVAHVPETVLGLNIALVGGLPVPPYGSDLVHGHADAIAAHVPVSVLCCRIACLRGCAQKVGSAVVILRDAVPLVVLLSQNVLSFSIPAFTTGFEF